MDAARLRQMGSAGRRAGARDQDIAQPMPILQGTASMPTDRQYGCAEDGCDCETPNSVLSGKTPDNHNQTNGYEMKNDGHDPVCRPCSSLWRFSELQVSCY